MSEYIALTNLPSQGVLYKEQLQDIKIRPYHGKEERYLSQINPLNLEVNFIEVLKNVLQGIEPENLTLGDRDYIVIWEYINSYSNLFPIQAICSHCLKEVGTSIDLNKIENIKLPEDYKEPYEVTLPVSGEKVNLRLLTVKDELKIREYEDKHGNAYTYELARMIVSDDDIVIKEKKIENMHSKDIAKIRAFKELFYHGPNMITTFTCPVCKKEDDVEVPFRLDFFYPNGETLRRTFGKEF